MKESMKNKIAAVDYCCYLYDNDVTVNYFFTALIVLELPSFI